jgi:acetylglutamate kinase
MLVYILGIIILFNIMITLFLFTEVDGLKKRHQRHHERLKHHEENTIDNALEIGRLEGEMKPFIEQYEKFKSEVKK